MPYLGIEWNLRDLLATFLFIWIITLFYAIAKGWKPKRLFYKLRSEGMPMATWNPFTGHLLALVPFLKHFPTDSNNTYPIGELLESVQNKDDIMYLDMWPFGAPLLVVASPDIAIQATQNHDLDKPTLLRPFFEPFAGGESLFTVNGNEWKHSRSMVAPGFNPGYLLGQASHIVEETSVFCEILREHAQKGDMFSLDELACNFTMDIIGSVCFGSRLNSQRNFNPLASAMRSQISWQCPDKELNLFKRWNPIRPFVEWYNSWQMNSYISKELEKRFQERQGGKIDTSLRSIIDLILDNYLSETSMKRSTGKLDKFFISWACIQLRLMIFAGHDSTGSTICYCYYLLSKNPSALTRLRAEHDEVFGTDVSKVSTLLQEQPDLINRLPYTHAVMKESLRVYPPAGGARAGSPDVELVGSDGVRYPTAGVSIWILHSKLHTDPKYWERPNEFLPERWLVGPEDALYPVKGAYRPFEFGQRNCVGQTLVVQDIKTVLAMTVRQFDITPAYAEWDELNPPVGLKTAHGDRAYQIPSGAAHPADGFPVKVTLRR